MTTRDLVLEDGEELVPPGDELLYRQITEHMVTAEGTLGTHAFGPSSADRGKPSFSRSTRVASQESRDWHSNHAKSRSLGVRAVPVDAVILARTWAIDDSAAPEAVGEQRAPGHCYVDYRGLLPREVKAVRASMFLASRTVETEDSASALLAEETPT